MSKRPKRPTIKTICAKTGLSTATVSKALRDSDQVRPETRAKVHAAARELGYSTNLNGVRLVTGKTYQVAVIMTAPSTETDEWEGVEYAQLLSGISRVLEGTRYRVALYAVPDFAASQVMVQQIVANHQADGIIFSGTRPDDPRIRHLQAAEFPFVTYGTSDALTPHAFVDADNASTIRMAMERLFARGHRRIALLNPPAALAYGQTRRKAYRAFLDANGLPFDPNLIVEGELTPFFGRQSVAALNGLSAPPTAYLCANEATALGALAGFGDCGLVHGQDAVINATDDLNVSAYFSPPLTTFYLPISRPAALLGAHILRAMEGEPVAALQTLLMPELRERSDDILRPADKDARS